MARSWSVGELREYAKPASSGAAAARCRARPHSGRGLGLGVFLEQPVHRFTVRDGRADGVLRFVDAGRAVSHWLTVDATRDRWVLLRLTDPGCSVAPARAMGLAGQAEIAFANVPTHVLPAAAVPVSDLQRLRRLALTARAHGAPRRAFDMAVDYAKERQQFAADIEVGRQLMMHCAELAGSGATPPEVGAIGKVFSGELMERFGEGALEILGLAATLSQGAPGALQKGRFEQNLRHSPMWVISIGSNQIQRSLIAQRGLGLPR